MYDISFKQRELHVVLENYGRGKVWFWGFKTGPRKINPHCFRSDRELLQVFFVCLFGSDLNLGLGSIERNGDKPKLE